MPHSNVKKMIDLPSIFQGKGDIETYWLLGRNIPNEIFPNEDIEPDSSGSVWIHPGRSGSVRVHPPVMDIDEVLSLDEVVVTNLPPIII